MQNNTSKVVHVAVGVIMRQGLILLALRADTQHQGGKWEFPGGKVEANESVEHALHRELHEEVAIRVTACEPFMQLQHSYPEKTVLLDIWLVTGFELEPDGREGQPLRWVSVAELSTLQFPDANQPIVARLQQQFSSD